MRANSIWTLVSHLSAQSNFGVDRLVSELLERAEPENTPGTAYSPQEHGQYSGLEPASLELAS